MKSRIFSILVALLCGSLALSAQPSHTAWKASCEKVSRGVYEITLTGSMERGWHVYDTTRTEMGPAPTEVVFNIEGEGEWAGEMQVSPAPVKVYDDVYMCEIGYYEDKVVFSRTLRTSRRPDAVVTVEVSWMECNDENCMPPSSRKFTLEVK